ncbi:hypothetical protein [Butyricicoccus porcorum]|uniref:Uncharacterized protein n=1 Tax=Butyricicoccus porcorum TaxID=1945634 RepID=A0A252F188_9FIRM|nr:hypothetical protein [Butyricicoccus porcorum]OUM19574.1 hypothetical protein CBW42_12400 [Butyricicoccus porcorum]
MLDLAVALAIGVFSKAAFTDPKRKQAGEHLDMMKRQEKEKDEWEELQYFRKIRRSVEKIAELNDNPISLIYSVIRGNHYNSKYVSGMGTQPTYRSDKILKQIGMTEEEFYVWIVNLWANDENVKHIYRKKCDNTAYISIHYDKVVAGRKMNGGSIYIPLANTAYWECRDSLDIDRSREWDEKSYGYKLEDKFIQLDPDALLRKYPKDLMDIVTGNTEWRKYEDKCGFLLTAPPRPKVAPHYDWEDEEEWQDCD